MKLIRQSSTEMIFRETSNFFGAICALIGSSLLIGTPLLLAPSLWNSLSNIIFSCARVEPQTVNCQSQKTSIFNQSSITIQTYNSVTGVKYRVEETQDSDGNRFSNHYVVVVTKRGKFAEFQGLGYINGVRGNPKKVQNFVNRLSQFLRSQEDSITIRQDWELSLDITVPVFFMCLFVLLGISIVHHQMRVVTFNFDKEYSYFTKSSLSILGFWKESYPLQEIQKVVVEEKKDSDGDSYYTVVIVMRSGRNYKLGFSRDKNELVPTADQIQAFLKM